MYRFKIWHGCVLWSYTLIKNIISVLPSLFFSLKIKFCSFLKEIHSKNFKKLPITREILFESFWNLARKCVLTNHIDWKTFESCFISSFEIKNILLIFFKEISYEKSKNCHNFSKSLNIELKLGMNIYCSHTHWLKI